MNIIISMTSINGLLVSRAKPVLKENLSARPMCPGGHIFLGNSVLSDRIYCPPLG